MNDDDDNSRLGMWIGLGVGVFITLATVLTLLWSHADTSAAPPVAAAPAVDMDATQDIPLTGELLGKVYFEVGKADVQPQGSSTIDATLATIQAAATRKVVLSGFHDLSGNPAQNAELAKNRAKAVREQLKAKGLAADRIVLRKPAETGADGPPEEARRVEIRLVD